MPEGVEALVGILMPCVGEMEGDHGGCELGLAQGALDEPGVPPASSRGVAYACRRVWMATPVLVRPARGWAVRKAPWTLERRIGAVAVGLGV